MHITLSWNLKPPAACTTSHSFIVSLNASQQLPWRWQGAWGEVWLQMLVEVNAIKQREEWKNSLGWIKWLIVLATFVLNAHILAIISEYNLHSTFYPTTKTNIPHQLHVTLLYWLSPAGLPQSSAEGLNKTHQEPTQTWPQLQLQTHPSRFQEHRQWQVGICCMFLVWWIFPHFCSIVAAFFYTLAFNSGQRRCLCLALRVLLKPVNLQSKVCHCCLMNFPVLCCTMPLPICFFVFFVEL